MTLYVFVLLLLFCLLLCLARLWHFYLPHHYPPESRIEAVHTTVHRLLKPRSPGDCPTCRLASTFSWGVEPAPPPVRPWREVKSRRGAPKRMNTQGFACVLFSSIGTGDVILLVSGKQGALTFTALFPAKAALNRLPIAVPKNRRSVLRAVVSAPPERNEARTCKKDRQSPPVR
jgi:hypothetical protein